MAVLDVQIDPTNARRGAAVIADSLSKVSDAAAGAGAAGAAFGGSFSNAFSSAALGFNVLAGRPFRAIASGIGLIVSNLVIGAAVNQWLELSEALGDLSAISGAVGGDLEILSAQARDFGASSVFASEQAATAFKLVASARPSLLQNFDDLGDVTKEVLLLSAAAGIDLPLAARVAGETMNQFGLEAAEAGRIVNVLAAGAKFGSSEIVDTSDALREAGTVAASANISFEELNAAIQLLAAGGIAGGRAGTALKNVILGLLLSTEAFNPSAHGFAGALRAVGQAGLSTNEQLLLVGREGINALSILTESGDALTDLASRLTGTSTATEQAEQRFDNLFGSMEENRQAWAALGETIGGIIAPLDRATTEISTFAARAINEALRVDNEWERLSILRARQIVGPGPQQRGLLELIGDGLRALHDDIEDAQRDLEEEAFLINRRRVLDIRQSLIRGGAERDAAPLEIRGDLEGAERVRAQAEAEIEHLNRVFETQRALIQAQSQERSGLLESTPSEVAREEAGLAALRAQQARRERERLAEERRESVATGLDPLRLLSASGFEQQLLSAASILENMRTPAERLANEIERIRLLGREGLFSADPTENTARTQEAIDFAQQQFDRAEAQRAAAAQRETERQQREAERRLQIAQREQQRREALGRRLLDQYAPLIALERNRADAIAQANQSAQDGILTNTQLAEVLRGINSRYSEEQDRLDGTTAALERRQSVLRRFLPGDAAFEDYLQALRDIDAAQLTAEQSQRAVTVALERYHQVANESTAITSQVVQEFLPLRAAQENYIAALDRIGNANLSSVETEMAKVQAINQYSRAISAANSELEDSAEDTRNLLAELQDEFDNLGSNIADSLAGSLVGAEQDFGAFLQRITQRLLAAQLETAVVNPLLGFAQNFVGGLFGGSNFNYAFGSTGGVQPSLGGGGLQFGGIARPGRSYLVGEAGPEILSQGRGGSVVTPLGNRGGGGNVYVSVQNGSGTEADVQESTTPEGDTVVDVVVGQALGRMGRSGELDSVFRSYGGSRQLISR